MLETLYLQDALVHKTKGPRMTRSSTQPNGIVFHDASFLTVYEKWSTSDGDLLAYKYHYQQGDRFLRYDLDETQRPGIPPHHMQVDTTGTNVHLPCGVPPIDLGEMLEVIIKHYLPRTHQT